MQKAYRQEKKQTVLWLALIYICSVLIRYLLALATRNYPTVSIDEFLYYSLGRSIATEGKLLFHGQAAIYNYIIYPLFLSPIYLFVGQSVNYFKIIQLWNIILMSLAVFPFYSLCKTMLKSRNTALWLTGLFALLPCFLLGEYIYSEVVIYPMFYTLMLCVYRYLKSNKIKYTIWIGVLGALLFYSKPGAIVPAILALLVFSVQAVKKRSGKNGIHVIAGIGSLIISFFAIKFLAEKILGYQGALLSVYNNQVFDSLDKNIDYFINNVVKYPYYFALACGIFPLVVSVRHYSECDREDKLYYLFLIITVLLTMFGISWTINRPERKDTLFMRYVEMYLPILLVYCAFPQREQQKVLRYSSNKINTICYLILAYVVVCTSVWGCTTGIAKDVGPHYFISLAVLYTNHIKGIANIIIILLSGITLYLLVKGAKKQTVIKISSILLIVLSLLNNTAGYISAADNNDRKLAEEAEEILQVLDNKEYVYVYSENQNDYGLDVNSRYNISRITEEDFLNNIHQHNGYYAPFVPSSVRGMNAVYKTADTDLLIVDENISPFIQFSTNTSGFVSANKSFKVVYFAKNQRIVDCVMDNDNNRKYTLRIYNEELLHNPVKWRARKRRQSKLQPEHNTIFRWMKGVTGMN